jgi:hypothetical protein
VLQPF